MKELTVYDAPIGNITRRTVCIVRFDQPLSVNDIRPGVFYQVTIDPEQISGDFIRFGGPGDEITGWQLLAFMRICHVIAVADDDGQLKTIDHDRSLHLLTQLRSAVDG
jgi:hypothetical protein